MGVYTGTTGADSLTGDQGADTIMGLEGIDSLIGAGGGDLIYGGADPDYLTGDVSAYDGAGGSDTLYGGDGGDILFGGQAGDSLFGGDGDDSLFGAAGFVFGSPTIDGAAVNWPFSYSTLEGGADSLDGGAGNDLGLLAFEDHAGPIRIDNSDPSQVNLVTENGSTIGSLTSVESLQFYGGSGDDSIVGGAGHDVFSGGDGDNTLRGGGENDYLSVGVGHSLLDGGDGTDTAQFLLGSTGVSIDLQITGEQAVGGGAFETFLSIENLSGTPYADTLSGDEGANGLYGSGGDDRLYGAGGADDLFVGGYNSFDAPAAYGGDGDDQVAAYGFGAFDVTLDGGAGDDGISETGAAVAALFGGDGADRISVDSLVGRWTVTLGAEADTLSLQYTSGAFHAGEANVVTDFTTGDGGDVLDLSVWIAGGALTGLAAGANPFRDGHLHLLQSGPDTLLQVDRDGGGDAYATLLTFQNTSAPAFTAANLGGYSQTDAALTLIGSDGSDSLTGGSLGDEISGLAGDDTLTGGLGEDIVYGGTGGDYIIGGAHNDSLYGGDGYDALINGDAADVFDGTGYYTGYRVIDPDLTVGAGNDLIDGGGGTDEAWLVYTDRTANLVFDDSDPTKVNVVTEGGAFAGSVTNVELVDFYAGSGNDSITLGDTAIISAGNVVGINLASGGGGDDTLIGGASRDALEGGPGNDLIDGRGGDDELHYDTATAGVTVDLSLTVAQDTGGAGIDTLLSIRDIVGSDFGDALIGDGGANGLYGGGGSDTLDGAGGNDTLYGGAEASTLLGGEGADSLRGGGESDLLTGAAGDDTLKGGAGDDTLQGGDGNDTLVGGSGSDTAIFSGARADYFVLSLTAGGLTDVFVSDLRPGHPDGVDDLQGVEQAQFSDGTVAVSDLGALKILGAPIGPADHVANGGFEVHDASTLSFDYIGQSSTYTPTSQLRSTVALQDWTVTGPVLLGSPIPDASASLDAQLNFQGLVGAVLFDGGRLEQHPLGLNAGAAYDLSFIASRFPGPFDGHLDVVWDGVVVDSLLPSATLDVERFHVSVTALGGGADDLIFRWTGGAMAGTYANLDDVRLIDTLQVNAADFVAYTTPVIVNYTDGVTPETGLLTSHFAVSQEGGFQPINDADYIVGGSANDTLVGGYLVSGRDGDDLIVGTAGGDFLFGGAGSDTADYTSSSAGVTLNLATKIPYQDEQVDFVHGYGGSAQGDLLEDIENLTGSGFADKLVGDGGANRLTGGGGDDLLSGQGGDDTLDGGAGVDTLQGGTGNDTFVVDDPADRVFEKPGEGTDTVLTALAVYSLAGATNVENLAYTGAGAFSGLGNASNNGLTGGAGDDTLNGLGGDDSLYGGAGNDTYIVGSGGGETTDKVFEAAGGGYDTVLVRGHGFTLAAGQEIEKLVADGAGRQILHGNELANLLVVNNVYGNVLDGGGGADTMLGGVGNDTFYVDDPNDSVSSGGGVDTVYTSLASYTLAAGFGTLVLTGEVVPGGAQSATGNAQANTLIGSDGDDFLDGKGGADHLVGGLGNDVYYVDDPRDVVVEQAGQGGDSLYTSLADYTAPDNVEIVYFTSTGPVVGHAAAGGSTLQDLGSFPSAAAALFVGGAGADQLYGGYGNDSLYGGGGHDVLNGGPGDDYIRSFTGDEGSNISGGDGTDLLTIERLTTTADLKLDLTLGAGGQALGEGSTIFAIEQVRIAGGSGNDSFTGGGLDDVLKGNAGADTLSGGGGADVLQGGAGHDRLTGGAGADTFRFDGPVAGSDDAVVDFVSGTDHVALSMTGCGIASLSDFDIVSAASGPTEAKATLVVDLAAHTLAWDADGTGVGAATLLATGAFTISAADYILF